MVKKTNSSLPIIELTQRIGDKDKRLISIANFIMNQDIAFGYRQDFIQAFIENTKKEKINDEQKRYQILLFEGFDKLISNRRYRSTGQVDESVLNNIKNKELSDFLIEKAHYELENKKSSVEYKSKPISSDQKIEFPEGIILPSDAFNFSDNKMVATMDQAQFNRLMDDLYAQEGAGTDPEFDEKIKDKRAELQEAIPRSECY